MKVYVLIRGIALPGKWAEAPQAALNSVHYLNNNSDYVGKYEIVQSASGPNIEFYWLCEYSSMADAEKDMELRGRDAGWSEVWKGIAETTDGATITSQTFQVKQ